MSMELPPPEDELFLRCDEILHYLWDPIGVRGIPAARDEYESYVYPIFLRVRQGASASEIAEVLNGFAAEKMGLTPNKQAAQDTAETLLVWRDRINEDFARKITGS